MSERLTKRQFEVLEKLYNKGVEVKVHTVDKDQKEISKELGITKQALNNHLCQLKENGYIRTGRGFIDITNPGLEILGKKGGEALIFIKVNPKKRNKVYEQIKENIGTAFRATGELNLILKLERDKLGQTLSKLSEIKGIEETKTHIVLKEL